MENSLQKDPSKPDFQTLFESAPSLFLVLTPDLKITAVSEAYLQATMTTREQILGRNIFDVFPDNPADPSATGTSNLSASLKRVLANCQPDTMAVQKYDIRRPAEEGGGFELRYWSPVNSPVMGPDGKVAYIIHRVQDVTEFVQVKEKDARQTKLTEELKGTVAQMEAEIFLRAQEIQETNKKLQSANSDLTEVLKKTVQAEEKFRSVLDAAPDAMVIVDERGAIALLNKQTEVLFGYRSQELLGKPMEVLIPERFNHRSTGAGQELWAKRKDGSEFPAEVSLSPIRIGDHLFVTAAIRDVTLHHHTEKKILALNASLQKRAEELEAVNKEMEAFSYSVSHDLRAPLRAIAGFAKILLEDHAEKLDEEGKRLLDIINNNTKKMGQLIDDLLALSRFGRQGMSKSEIDVKDMVNSAWNDLKQSAAYPNMELCVSDLPPAYGDRSLLHQVVVNLLSNAVKYSSKKEKIRVEVGGKTDGVESIFHVKDNGVGFDMAYAGKLFGVFQRLHGQEEFEGTGVGLAIIHRIISRHGGRVWADAKVNEGATFYFSLPKNAEAEPDAARIA